MRGVGGGHGVVQRALARPERLGQRPQVAFELRHVEPKAHPRREQPVAVTLEARRRANDEGQRLPPGAGVRVDLGKLGLLVQHVGQEDVVGALGEQRLDVPVRDPDGETGLGHGHVDAVFADALVGLARQHGPRAEVGEERGPEGQPVEGVHGARDAHGDGGVGAALRRLFEGRQQQALAQGDEVVDDRLLVDLGALAVAVGALVAPVGLLAFDGELADVALVGAVLADEILDRVVDRREVPAAEGRDLAGAPHALASEQRHADRAHHAVVGRHDDLFTEDLGEGGGHSVVVGGAALEEDAVADLALAHQAVQVVVGDRVGESGDEVFALRATRLVAHHVAFHEHGAALAQADRRGRLQGKLGELADDLDAELLGLLFEERAGARRAGFVHGEVDDDAVLHGDELGVLAADLEDGVDLARDAAADEVGTGLVGGDLVGDEVGAAELADELAARTGGAHAEHADAVADLVADLG